MRTLNAEAVKQMLTDLSEIAFLDVREHGQYGEGHPFFAVNCPYSRLEIKAPMLMPCRQVPVVLLDNGDGIAGRAAHRLNNLGYLDVAVVEGGAPAWHTAGFNLFKGVNVPSKVFGEIVEHQLGTPLLEPDRLRQMLADDTKVVVLDGRAPEEFAKMNIPSARSCPNAELGYRIGNIVDDCDTTVVVNCAGRTRSIIGAESLRALGIENPVYALKNGTQGWHLAGYDLERGSVPETFGLGLTEPARRIAIAERARAFRREFEIPTVSGDVLARWLADGTRTTYLFDVRTREEYEHGHLRGALHAPGGQLVQATDHWVAVRGARLVLADDLGLRAGTTAHWLRAMGHDAYVLDHDVTTSGDFGTEPDAPDLGAAPELPVVSPEDYAANPADMLLDLSPGTQYRQMHIKGSVWGIRPRLDRLSLPADIVVVADDFRVARISALDLHELGVNQVSVLSGDTAAWQAAGLAIEKTPDTPSDNELIDYLFFVHDRHEGNMEAARQYIAWETNLLNVVDEQERSVFSTVRAKMELTD